MINGTVVIIAPYIIQIYPPSFTILKKNSISINKIDSIDKTYITDEINEEDFTVAEKHFKQYTDDVARYEKTMELLAKRYEFVFLKL